MSWRTWRRLDHIASLAGELLVCVLPWNPLAWWSRSRLGQFAELACDDWVLASGSVGTDYAASLLELLPQRATALALAAVSSRGGLVDRVRHILEERRSNPRIGRGWAVLTGVVMILAVSAIALAQARPAASATGLVGTTKVDHVDRCRLEFLEGRPHGAHGSRSGSWTRRQAGPRRQCDLGGHPKTAGSIRCPSQR